MINKIETTLITVVDDIKKFYDKKTYHFMTLNGVQLDENRTQIQWIFAKYGDVDETTMFYTEVTKDDLIPSIEKLIPNATISQREVVDMFGLNIENSTKGLYLDEDSEQMPLSNCGI